MVPQTGPTKASANLKERPSADAKICDHAAQQAAQTSNVPLSVLRAITRTETGRARGGALEPWPWTVNMEGAGRWFATETEAHAYVVKHHKRGARSFDVGCFQINYKWHGDQFSSIADMFDPFQNAAYAARFLSQLFSETGDWSSAAGAYHSRTPKYASRYSTRFDRIRKTVEGPMPARIAAVSASQTRQNSYPLLQAAGAAGRFGSLVPLDHSTRPALVALTVGGS
ncbi:transglycosylase SLT domain-containing protein [Roseovarius pelagicus]|uniref:Transglycosylase SLT domain-containing protein n=2 Tax=Roseovarius pelagicus TaxID=2980108 RepID=A0ABY6DG73_9RHOB|nr:transglycosylase SLT domain-containing protein [Roseovarius pelagicus]